MQILHVIPQFPYFGGRTIVGGYSSILLSLALAQSQAGHETTIVTYVHGRAGRIDIEPGVKVISLFEQARPGSLRFGFRFVRAVNRWVRGQGSAFDLVHVHSGFADYFVVSASLKRLLGAPVVHSLYCPVPAHGGRWNLPLVKQMLRRAAGAADALTAISRNVADSLVRFGVRDADHVHVIPPVVDTERFTPDGDTCGIRRELGVDPDETAILFVGNARAQKNLAGVLQAFAKLRESRPRVRLVVTTELKQSSSDEDMRRLHGMMEDLDLSSHVVQRGVVGDMPSLMRACDLLVAPFLDTFGPSDYFMAALEAMACAKPVIVSRVGGMAEVVDPAVGRLIEPTDVDAMAGAMEELAADDRLRKELGDAARARCRALFDPARIVREMSSVYEGCGAK